MLPMTNQSNPENSEVDGLKQEAASLEAQLERYTQQIAVLNDAVSQKRREAQEAYRKRYADTYKDVDVPKALTGAATRHTFAIGLATYAVVPPSGEAARNVLSFVNEPTARVRQADGTYVATDLGPVSLAEVYVLKWLVELGMTGSGQARKMDGMPIPDRLRHIRQMPEQTINHIAERCKTLETYLNVCLELDLGNS